MMNVVVPSRTLATRTPLVQEGDLYAAHRTLIGAHYSRK
jgi:hypothetical protein